MLILSDRDELFSSTATPPFVSEIRDDIVLFPRSFLVFLRSLSPCREKNKRNSRVVKP